MIRQLMTVLLLALLCAAQDKAAQKPDAASELRRQTIERRTVDAVIVGRPTSEAEHGYRGEATTEGQVAGRKWRGAKDGWFSYELKVDDKPLKIVCTYVRFPVQPTSFDIIVDGEKVADETLANRGAGPFDVDYLLPEALTRNKKAITVRFQAHTGASTGAVLDVRTVWADIQE